MDKDRAKIITKLEKECTQLTLKMTESMSDIKKRSAGLNQRMMLEQLDRLLLRHSTLEKVEMNLFNFDIKNISVRELQKQYVNEVEGIAQHTYALLSHYIKWIKSILPHPDRNVISNSVANLIENSDKNTESDRYWQSVIKSEYDFRTRYVDHPGGMVSSYTWHTESLPDQRTYVHYHDVGKGTTFAPPHPDLVVNAVIWLIQSGCQKYLKIHP
jgi:hypothetical protein